MTEIHSWASAALNAFYYAVSNPVSVLLLAFAAVFAVGSIAIPIWGAIFGRAPRARGGVEPLHPIARLVLALAGLGVLWQMIAPWL